MVLFLDSKSCYKSLEISGGQAILESIIILIKYNLIYHNMYTIDSNKACNRWNVIMSKVSTYALGPSQVHVIVS